MPDITEMNKKTESDIIENTKDEKKIITHKSANWLLIGLIGLMAGLFSGLVLTNLFGLTPLGAIIFGSPGFLLALVGAFIGKRSIVSALIGATVGAILWLLFAINTCLLCQ